MALVEPLFMSTPRALDESGDHVILLRCLVCKILVGTMHADQHFSAPQALKVGSRGAILAAGAQLTVYGGHVYNARTRSARLKYTPQQFCTQEGR